uniref:Uncharacterized protein C1orf131-like n=1 Tax=Phallusia mammillata TaxID=59560 RepID=A0A6F9D7T9_9ASCI|nr:uncharacterized protein C1orf131-like [Phallusia mammillata]
MSYFDEELKEFYLSQLRNKESQDVQTKSKRTKKKVNNQTNEQQYDVEEKSSSPIAVQPSRKVEVVVFKRHKTNKKKIFDEKSTEETVDDTDMSRLKPKKLLSKLQWDVTAFGLEGYSKEEKRKLEAERAIKLGAKPKKRQYVNYKVLMEERKKQKLEEEASHEKEASQKSKKKRQKNNTKTVFWQDSLKTKNFGQVGSFKNGVLKVSSFDIKSVKRK